MIVTVDKSIKIKGGNLIITKKLKGLFDRTIIFSAIWWLSPLQVTGLQI
jgi:hypothetical protein